MTLNGNSMYKHEVIKLYRTDYFSSWSTTQATEKDEEAYFIKVVTKDEDLYFMLGSSNEAFHVV